jgi:hypothetical protein
MVIEGKNLAITNTMGSTIITQLMQDWTTDVSEIFSHDKHEIKHESNNANNSSKLQYGLQTILDCHE